MNAPVQRGGILRTWLICSVAALVLSVAAAGTAFGERCVRELLAGWTVATVNGGMALGLQSLSIGHDMKRFMWLGVAANSLRFLALLGIMLAVYCARSLDFRAFALAAAAGCIVFMAGEIYCLHVRR